MAADALFVMPKPRSSFTVEDLGLVEYETAWRLQEAYAADIATGRRSPALLLMEHPHVYTFGRRGDAKNLLWGEEQLKQKGISVHWVDRGGDVTYHGPGQLVGYPLIPLTPLRPAGFDVDYVGYIRRLEKMLIAALARFGVAAGRRSGKSGVWIQPDAWSRCPRCRPENREKPAKIAAIGVKVDARGITRHGFALNVNPDMGYWDGIIACGLQDEPVVSLADLLTPFPSMRRVKEAVSHAFGDAFDLSQ